MLKPILAEAQPVESDLCYLLNVILYYMIQYDILYYMIQCGMNATTLAIQLYRDVA